MDQQAEGILERFCGVILDMNNTFMFGEDRFGPAYDYAVTHQSLGGRLPAREVRRVIDVCYNHLNTLYSDPDYHDCFPTIRQTLRMLPVAKGLNDEELDLLELTFAIHELGHIPVQYAIALQRLASSHRLALVADIWSEKQPWLDELDRAGVAGLFDVMVFSSEIGCVKPSPRPFLAALEKLDASPEECVVIGDSVRRDIGGAEAAGLSAIWIGHDDPPKYAMGSTKDLLNLIG